MFWACSDLNFALLSASFCRHFARCLLEHSATVAQFPGAIDILPAADAHTSKIEPFMLLLCVPSLSVFPLWAPVPESLVVLTVCGRFRVDSGRGRIVR